MKKFLLNENDRKELIALLDKSRKAPPPYIAPRSAPVAPREADSYWALPPCEQGLPAATYESGQLKSIGINCCLFKHNFETQKMDQMLDAQGLPERVVVYNYFPRPENGLTQIHQQKDGSWANARPDQITTRTATTTVGPIEADESCTGECIWTADANGVWGWPTGGCASATTTPAPTTTTGTTGTPTGYTTVLPSPSTIAPCSDSRCLLACVPRTGTTTYPRSAYVYAMATTGGGTGTTLAPTSCPSGCACYGLGDDCWLNGGELRSHCIGPRPTSTVTTLNPTDGACTLAGKILSPTPADAERYARKIGGDWTLCGDCTNSVDSPLFPFGGDGYRYHDYPTLVSVYESPCVQDPCKAAGFTTGSTSGTVTFYAFPYLRQLSTWYLAKDHVYMDYDNNRFVANWFACNSCGTGQRPVSAPPYWLNDAASDQGNVQYDAAKGVYIYEAACISGPACEVCPRAPYPDLVTTTATPSSATGTSATSSAAPTTTQAPCGCVRPSFCPQPYECTKTQCRRGGGATTIDPSLPCFPDNTTTTGTTATTAAPPTTLPGDCIDWRGARCDCSGNGGGGTTIPPVQTTPAGPGGCPPGYIYVAPADPCDSGHCEQVATIPPQPTLPPAPCAGFCMWQAILTATGGIRWATVAEACTGSQCACVPPGTAPSTCGEIAVNGCAAPPPATTGTTGTTGTPTTTSRPICDCCTTGTTTTANPCTRGRCRYAGDGSGGWVMKLNQCGGTCAPCASAGSIGVPSDDTCHTLTLGCGQSPPTTTGGPTTTGAPLGDCCFYYGGFYNCSRDVTYAACAASPGGAGTWSWMARGSCAIAGRCGATTTPDPIGDCCFQGSNPSLANCLNGVPASACIAAGGAALGLGSCSVGVNCGATTTPEPTGDCCYMDFTGTFICGSGFSSSFCSVLSGSFMAAGTCALGGNCNPTTTTAPTTTGGGLPTVPP